jgi:hypothetical protein
MVACSPEDVWLSTDDGQLAGRNICRACFFKTIIVLIESACVGTVLLVLINMHGENNIKYMRTSLFLTVIGCSSISWLVLW